MDIFLKTSWMNIGYAIILIIGGYFIAGWASSLVERGALKHFSKHHGLLAKRFIFHALFLVFLVSGLQHLGFNLGVLLGAAGILTVGISFASQTAASNLVSGLFLLFEMPFKVGDTIVVKNITGTVDSIDLMSTKIKTSDNQLVRIPNESMMKSEIINQSYFKTRRLDILLTIAYENDMELVKNSILQIAKNHKMIHKNPEPVVIVHDLNATGIELKIMVWTDTHSVNTVRNQLIEAINHAFGQENIEISNAQIVVNPHTTTHLKEKQT
jgi:small conductance mechanosensitive channel